MNKKYIMFALIVLFLCSSLFFLRHVSLASIQRRADYLAYLATEYPLPSLLLYLVIYFMFAFFPMPGEALLSVTGGYIYGSYLGTFLAVLATTLGAVCAFLVTRFMIGDWVKKRFTTQYQFIEKNMKNQGELFLLGLRFMPTLPSSVVNYIAGLTPVSLMDYALMTMIGVTPITFLYVTAGQKLRSLTSLRGIITPSWLLILFGLAFLAMLPTIIRFLKK